MRTFGTIRSPSGVRSWIAISFLVVLFGMPVKGIAADVSDQEARDEFYGKRENWTENTGHKLNISNFIFRDVNRNGHYDLGDRALANVLVRMTTPDGTKLYTASNLNGFANFAMSATQTEAEIRTAGTYVFQTIGPPGWSVTSDNAQQSMTFEVKPGAYADIIALDPVKPIGLAPDLTISGRVLRRDTAGNLEPETKATMTITGPDDERWIISPADGGTFSIPVEPGNWAIAVRDDLGKTVVRHIQVKDNPVVASAIVVNDLPMQARTKDVLLDFESIAIGELTKIPSGFGGVNWDNMVATKFKFYRAQGMINGTTSGNFVAYNGSGHPVALSHPEGFDFVGGYFGVAWPRAEGEELVVEAYRNGSLIGSESIPLSSFGPVWFDADYRNIHALVLKGKHYWQFVADDLVVRPRGKTPAAGNDIVSVPNGPKFQ